jgi:hypothetical protein
MKNARISVRWSLRRVCCSVMNSRSARNENRPKKIVEPTGPESQASQNSTVPTHSARKSRMKRSQVSPASSCLSRRPYNAAPSVTSSSTPNRIRNSRPTCSSGVSRFSAPISALAGPPQGR